MLAPRDGRIWRNRGHTSNAATAAGGSDSPDHQHIEHDWLFDEERSELEHANIKVDAVCPGFTATDNNKFLGPGTVEEATREPVRVAMLDSDSPSGGLTNFHGTIPR
ncbi:hypothetical protein [Agrobacterium tumefaciens]|uniref:hypothetical protein n=1 Tax=Agrobacterium tumefaciens TaxID=358 RepID=UPI001BA5F72A